MGKPERILWGRGKSLRTWEFHPLILRFRSSQTLWNPESLYGDWPYRTECPGSLRMARSAHKPNKKTTKIKQNDSTNNEKNTQTRKTNRCNNNEQETYKEQTYIYIYIYIYINKCPVARRPESGPLAKLAETAAKAPGAREANDEELNTIAQIRNTKKGWSKKYRTKHK